MELSKCGIVSLSYYGGKMLVDEVRAPFRHGNHTNSSSVRPHLKSHSNIPTKRGKWLVCPRGLAWESVKKEHSIQSWGY